MIIEIDILISAHYLQCRRPYLTNHDGEHKHSDKVIDELKHNLKKCSGSRQATDGEQSFHGKVVTADITENKTKQDSFSTLRQMYSKSLGNYQPWFDRW